MATASTTAGVVDYATGGLNNVGKGWMSKAVAGLTAVTTAATHDPATDGALGAVERIGAGVGDGLWSLAGGPAAIADALTGGNVSGGVKAAATTGAVVADMVRGDYKSADKFTEKLKDGDYGRVARTAANAGDWWGEQAHDAFADDYYLALNAKPVVRDGQRELRRKGLMQ